MLGSIWQEPSNRHQPLSAWVYFSNGRRFRAYPDCHMSSAVMYARIPDSRDILLLRAHIGQGTRIDVGANVGVVTFLLADQVQHALLFEPNPITAARARANLELNGLRFEVHEVALSDTAGTVEFEDAGGVSGCNRTVVGLSTSVPTRNVPMHPA